MKEELFNLTTLTIFYNWANGDGSHHSFGAVSGARKFIEDLIKNDTEKTINSYSIEEYAYIPCDRNDPEGKLYLGVRYHEFVEVK